MMTTKVKLARQKLISAMAKRGLSKAIQEKYLSQFDDKYETKEKDTGFIKNAIKASLKPVLETGVQAYNTLGAIKDVGVASVKKLQGDEEGYQENLEKANINLTQERRILGEDIGAAVDVNDSFGGAVKDIVSTGFELGSMAASPSAGITGKTGTRMAFNAAQGGFEGATRAWNEDESIGGIAKEAVGGALSQSLGAEAFRGLGKGITKTTNKAIGLKNKILGETTDISGKKMLKEGAEKVAKETIKKNNAIIAALNAKITSDEIVDPQDIIQKNILEKQTKELIISSKNPIVKTATVKNATKKGVDENILDNIVSRGQRENDLKADIFRKGEYNRTMSNSPVDEFTTPTEVLVDEYLIPLQNTYEKLGKEIGEKVSKLGDKQNLSIVDEGRGFLKEITSKTGINSKIVKTTKDGVPTYGLDFSDSKRAYDKDIQKKISSVFDKLLNSGDKMSANSINNQRIALDDIIADLGRKGYQKSDSGMVAIANLKSALLSKLGEVDPGFRETITKYAVLSDTMSNVSSKLLKGETVSKTGLIKGATKDALKRMSSEGTAENKEFLDTIIGAMEYAGIKTEGNTDVRRLIDFSKIVSKANKKINANIKKPKSLLNLKDAAGAVVSNFGKIKYASGIAGTFFGDREIKYLKAIADVIDNYGDEVVDIKKLGNKLPFAQRAVDTISKEFSPGIAKGVVNTAQGAVNAGKAVGTGLQKAAEITNVDDLLLGIKGMYDSGQLSSLATQQINRIIRQQAMNKNK